jgi:hypothetical protein
MFSPLDGHVPHWTEALASAKAGAHYRITQLVFAMVRDRCHEIGLHEGDEVACIDNRDWALDLEKSDGRRVILERQYAWFVSVDRVDGLGSEKSA